MSFFHLSNVVTSSNAHLLRQYARENPFTHYGLQYEDDVYIDSLPGREELWIRQEDIPHAIRYAKNILKNRQLIQQANDLGVHFKSWREPWRARYHYSYHQYNVEFDEPVSIDPRHFHKTKVHEVARLFRRKCINYMRRMVPILDGVYRRFKQRIHNHPQYHHWMQGFEAAVSAHIKQFIPEDSWSAFEQRWHIDVERDDRRRAVLMDANTRVVYMGMARFDNDMVWGWQHGDDLVFHRAQYGEDPAAWLNQCMQYHPAPSYVVYMRPSHYHLASALATMGEHIVLAQQQSASEIDKMCRQALRDHLQLSNPAFLPEKAFPKLIQPYEWEHPSYELMSISANPHDYPGHVHVFSDASLQEDGRNGMAAVVMYEGAQYEYTQSIPFSDSIQALEIEAAVTGLLNAHMLYDAPIALFSDNECVVMLLQAIQHHGYIMGRWSDVFPRERCKKLQPILAKTAVRWMKGHVHYPGNMRADYLANQMTLGNCEPQLS